MRLLPVALFLVLPLLGQATPKSPAIGDLLTTSLGLRFCYCPAGSFLMGSAVDELDHGEAESPQHKVSFAQGFWFGETLVTQSQYQKVMDTNPSFFMDSGLEAPVETVTWDDAQAFLQHLNALDPAHTYRLPTEAEWEYACRAGTTTPFNTGVNINTSQANYSGVAPYNGGAKGIFKGSTNFVKLFAPNAWGLYDMHGNVWEWCEDPWHDNYKGAPSDGSVWEIRDWKGAGSMRRVLRGGSWSFGPRLLRSAYRSGVVASYRKNNCGFRVVCAPVETPKP